MNIILTAVDQHLADAWDRFCAGLPGVMVHRGSILDVACDAIVSPANSFGFMDGGIDAIYLRHFGPHLGEDLRRLIQTRHHGELLVGAADVVETGAERIPYMIAAPTMRVPMALRESVNAYLSARAVFLLIMNGTFIAGPRAGTPIADAIKTVAFPGLGTGIGQLGPSTCAHQMRTAIEDVVLGKRQVPRTGAEAGEFHQMLFSSRPATLQHS